MKVHYDFSGHTVLVFGGASGVGEATARECAALGAAVWSCDVGEAAGSADAVPPAGGGSLVLRRVDVASREQVHAFVAQALAATGRIDGVVVTAAVQRRTPIEAIALDDWQRHLDVNLTGLLHVLQAVVPTMKAQHSGSIVAFTSGLASAGWPGASAYAATKAGIVGIVKCVAQELRPFGVRINALSPGLVATPIFLDSANAEEVAMYERVLGVSTPAEVVPTLLHLLGDGSTSISGNVVERRLIPARGEG